MVMFGCLLVLALSTHAATAEARHRRHEPRDRYRQPVAVSHGAVSMDPLTGAWGWAVNYSDPVAARNAALSRCGGGCTVVVDIETGTCAAIALSWEGGGWGWARAANRAWAEAQALARCSTVGYDCRVSVWACN